MIFVQHSVLHLLRCHDLGTHVERRAEKVPPVPEIASMSRLRGSERQWIQAAGGQSMSEATFECSESLATHLLYLYNEHGVQIA